MSEGAFHYGSFIALKKGKGVLYERRNEGRKAARIAIIGFGGIASVHHAAFLRLKACGVPLRLVAVCDSDERKFREQKRINLGNQVVSLADHVHIYTDIDALLTDDFDIADICLLFYIKKLSLKCFVRESTCL